MADSTTTIVVGSGIAAGLQIFSNTLVSVSFPSSSISVMLSPVCVSGKIDSIVAVRLAISFIISLATRTTLSIVALRVVCSKTNSWPLSGKYNPFCVSIRFTTSASDANMSTSTATYIETSRAETEERIGETLINESACDTVASIAVAVAPSVAKIIAALIPIDGVTGAAVLVIDDTVGKIASELIVGEITLALQPIGVRIILTCEPVDMVNAIGTAVLVMGVKVGTFASVRSVAAGIDVVILIVESASAALMIRAGATTLADALIADNGESIESACVTEAATLAAVELIVANESAILTAVAGETVAAVEVIGVSVGRFASASNEGATKETVLLIVANVRAALTITEDNETVAAVKLTGVSVKFESALAMLAATGATVLLIVDNEIAVLIANVGEIAAIALEIVVVVKFASALIVLAATGVTVLLIVDNESAALILIEGVVGAAVLEIGVRADRFASARAIVGDILAAALDGGVGVIFASTLKDGATLAAELEIVDTVTLAFCIHDTLNVLLVTVAYVEFPAK